MPPTECHGFGVACDKHGALGCGRGGRTIAVRLWFEDFDVAVTGFVQSLILIPDTGCAIVAGLTRREEMSCFSCERSPIHARWHVFQAKSIGVMLFTLFTTLFCLALGSPTSARDCTACVRVENMTITVSTDGSALGNPNGPMGWYGPIMSRTPAASLTISTTTTATTPAARPTAPTRLANCAQCWKLCERIRALSHCSSNRIRNTPSIARPSGSKAGRRTAGKIHRKNL